MNNEYFSTLTIAMTVLLCWGCAAHVPAFAPSSVQVCLSYERDRVLDPEAVRARRFGTSACVTFDDRSVSE